MSDPFDGMGPDTSESQKETSKSLQAEHTDSDQRKATQAMRVMMMSYQGPLPPPAVLEAYNQVVPHGAERLFAVFEAQSSHRQYLEKQVVDANVRLQLLGFIAAFVIAVLVIAGGIFLAYRGMSLGGFAMIITALVALVSVFLVGKRKQSDERANKRKNMPKV